MQNIDYPPPSYNETVYKNQQQMDSEYDLNEDVIEHEAYIKNQLEKDYPIKFVIMDSTIMILLNISLILLQIFAINNNAALSFIGSAIWSGVYNLITVFLVLLTIKIRNPTLMMIGTTMKLFGMIISFGGFILIHMVAFYHYNCQIAISYYRPCYNKSMKPIHYSIIILGIPCVVLSLLFFIYFQFKLMGRLKFYKHQYMNNQYNHQNADNIIDSFNLND